jgi:SAM-dependent methyltransferase
MLQAARVSADDRVLDIACGTGEPTLAAAEQVGPAGYVLGTDFVEEMLAFAREKAAKRGLDNVDFRRVDGEELEVLAGSFEVVLIRWGLMFMPDPLACLKRAHRALHAGGRLAVACWTGSESNPAIGIPTTILRRRAKVSDTTSVFAFADPHRLRSTLEEAGFSDVEIEHVQVDEGGEHDDGLAFFSFLRETAAPIGRAFAELPPDEQRDVEREIAAAVEAHPKRQCRGRGLAVPAGTWIAHAHA